MKDLLVPLGYKVMGVPINDCLHLKTGVGKVSPDTVLINRNWVPKHFFKDHRVIDVDPAEPRAAGALLIEDTVVYPATHKKTLQKLLTANIKTVTVDLSELVKAEAGVTCSSIVFEA